MDEQSLEGMRDYLSENEFLLRAYCDLTPARWYALQEAVTRPPVKMNGAMRQAMGGMIDERGLATNYGVAVYQRALELMENGRPKGANLREIMSPVRAANHLKRTTGRIWVRSAHAKLLVNLARAPGQSYKWVCSVFSYKVVDQLLDNYWVWGLKRTGWPLVLSDLGYGRLGRFVYGAPVETPLAVAMLLYLDHVPPGSEGEWETNLKLIDALKEKRNGSG